VQPPESLELIADALLAAPAVAPGLAAHGTALPPASLHLSVTRTLYLKDHQVAPLRAAVRRAVATWARAQPASARPPLRLPLWVRGAGCLPNDDGSCVFLVLRMAATDGTLAALVAALDEALGALGHPPYYPDPDWHVSVAWSLGRDTWETERVEAAGAAVARSALGRAALYADAVIIKAGPHHYPIPLSD
jgi:hypothetical protein